MRTTPHFALDSTVKRYPTQFPYEKIKNDILGKRYQLSLTFIGETRAQHLNVTYRKKDYTPNVLSFPLDETTGEVYICPNVARHQAHEYELSQDGYMCFLFIHGCLHLKGYRHGDTMERLEQKYRRKYNVS